ncbi:MAG: hypothetical protein IIC56_01755 [Proteobacteria bacterium]|nr:hypothetical protein [Pseudomonadota bacterium]
MYMYALYYKLDDGSLDGPAVGLFESEFEARQYVFNDASCPRTEFEIVRHKVLSAKDSGTGGDA